MRYIHKILNTAVPGSSIDIREDGVIEEVQFVASMVVSGITALLTMELNFSSEIATAISDTRNAIAECKMTAHGAGAGGSMHIVSPVWQPMVEVAGGERLWLLTAVTAVTSHVAAIYIRFHPGPRGARNSRGRFVRR